MTDQAHHAYECWAPRGGKCRPECSCSCHKNDQAHRPTPPPIGTVIHVGYATGDLAFSNQDSLPCRAAIVTAVQDYKLTCQVIPAWSVAYSANVVSWHHIVDCTRGKR